MANFYITTTLPYVNADPHIGFALEIVQADVLARWHRLLEDEVVFNTGTDEHGLKIYTKAKEAGRDVQEYVDSYAARFHQLKDALNLSYTNFIRTTDQQHKDAAQEFWKRCEAAGDIYKKSYRVKYCVGCELEKTDSELEHGKCSIHPTYEIQLIEEENYFFRFSKYQQKLLDLYEKHEDIVVPESRLHEIKKFVQSGLQDFSISRVKEKMPWGVPVPGDDTQVMYVWFDALVNYISTLGWPKDSARFTSFWPGTQVAGKDNLRQQAAMWQAMLFSAGLQPSKQIFIHGFLTANGQKISKSIGNVVDPFDVVKKYGTDTTRLYLLGAIPAFEDGDFSYAEMQRFYDTFLRHGIGNLTLRTLSMVEKYCGGTIPAASEDVIDVTKFWNTYHAAAKRFAFHDMVKAVHALITQCDELISAQAPWAMVKEGKSVDSLMYQLAESLRHLALALFPLAPQTAEQILAQIGVLTHVNANSFTWGKLAMGTRIKKQAALFPEIIP